MQTELRKVDSFYENSYVGRPSRSQSYCWAAFGPDPFKECKKHAHQSIAIGTNGLRMFVNIDTKPANDRLKAAVFRPELLKELRQLHKSAPFELVLEKSVRDFPHPGTTEPRIRLHSSLLTDDSAWNVFAKTVKSTRFPYFCLDRPAVPPRELIDLTEREAIKRVVDSFKLNHDVVKIVNGF